MGRSRPEYNYSGRDNEAGSGIQLCRGAGIEIRMRPVKIRACLFFDGTLNNRSNVKLGLMGKGLDDDSYRNGLTNIALMEERHQEYPEVDYSFSRYIEGIGTTDEEGDSSFAAAIGKGHTGIVDKVERAIADIIQTIVSNVECEQQIEYVHVDGFGFSRGAAALRNFVYTLLLKTGATLRDRLQSEGYVVKDVHVKFVGLFDTVASLGLCHSNDTDQLHLDAISHAERIVQLAAAEEHRKYFSLTNIKSAPHGVEVFLPGAHSDVGGGYHEEMDEVQLQIMDLDTVWMSEAEEAAIKREKDWLLKTGWYEPHEIHDVDVWHQLKVTRLGISNTYSRIPLKMMAEYAAGQGVTFRPELIEENPIPETLQQVEKEIKRVRASSPDYWLDLTSEMMKKLRHGFLHFSAFYGSTAGSNQPQFTGDNPILGRRKRTIRNG